MKGSQAEEKRQTLLTFEGAVALIISTSSWLLEHPEHLFGYDIIRLEEVRQQMQEVLSHWEDPQKETS